jgi:antitoxin VapB
MPFHVRDSETDALVRELARKRGVGLTEAVRIAVFRELQSEKNAVPLREQIAALRAEVMKRPKTGLAADKAFFDDLSGKL